MSNESVALRLIELIYDAAAEPRLWPAFLEALSDALGATATNLVSHGANSSDGAVIAAVRLDPDAARAYGDYYGGLDPWARAARTSGVMAAGSVHIGDALVPHGTVEKTEFYQDFGRHFGTARILVAGLHVDGPMVSSLSINRPENAPFFTERDRQLVLVLMPHLQRALAIDRRIAGLEQANAGLRESLSLLPFAAIVLAPDGRVMFTNEAATTVLAARDGLTVSARGLTASLARETRLIADLVREAGRPEHGVTRPAGSVLKISRPSGRTSFTLTIMRLRGHELIRPTAAGCAVGVFIDDPEQPCDVNEDVLRAIYDLTPTEAIVAADIAAGLTTRESATRRGVHPSTVQWHLKHVLAKTQSHTQAALVRLLARGPGALVPPKR